MYSHIERTQAIEMAMLRCKLLGDLACAVGEIAVVATHLDLLQQQRRLDEPRGRRQTPEQRKHERRGRRCAGEPRPPFSARIAYPNADGEARGVADRPGIAQTPARAGLPGDLLRSGEVTPIRLFARASDLEQCS